MMAEPTSKVQTHGPRLRLARWTRRYRVVLALTAVIVLLFTGTALAAEVAGEDEVYTLPQGEVVEDDLYVGAGEILIEGTVEGDLVAAGGYIEVSGVVMGDVIAAGGGIVISGVVQDDARLAGGGIVVSGSIGDDLFVAGGGGWPTFVSMPIQINDREVPQGVRLPSDATVGGDAYVVGGSGMLAGAVGGDLFSGMNWLNFSGRVAGDANLNATNLTVNETGRVQGTLRYSTSEMITVPEGVAANVIRTPWETQVEPQPRNLVVDFLWWMVRTGVIVLGLGVLGWLLLTFFPNAMHRPAAVMDQETAESGILGLVVAVLVLPVSVALVFLGVLIWGWFPGGVVMFTLLFGTVGLIWLISPTITGLWLGRKLGDATGAVRDDLPAMLLGIAVLVLVARLFALIPCVGGLVYLGIYLVSFALAVGSWLMVQRRKRVPRVTGPVPPESQPAT